MTRKKKTLAPVEEHIILNDGEKEFIIKCIEIAAAYGKIPTIYAANIGDLIEKIKKSN